MKTLKPHSQNKWGIYTERKSLVGEIKCTEAQAKRIQDGLMTNELRGYERPERKTL